MGKYASYYWDKSRRKMNEKREKITFFTELLDARANKSHQLWEFHQLPPRPPQKEIVGNSQKISSISLTLGVTSFPKMLLWIRHWLLRVYLWTEKCLQCSLIYLISHSLLGNSRNQHLKFKFEPLQRIFLVVFFCHCSNRLIPFLRGSRTPCFRVSRTAPNLPDIREDKRIEIIINDRLVYSATIEN